MHPEDSPSVSIAWIVFAIANFALMMFALA